MFEVVCEFSRNTIVPSCLDVVYELRLEFGELISQEIWVVWVFCVLFFRQFLGRQAVIGFLCCFCPENTLVFVQRLVF